MSFRNTWGLDPRMTETTAELDKYLMEKSDMGLVFPWSIEEIRSISYTRDYSEIDWSAVCSPGEGHKSPHCRYWRTHTQTLISLVLPEIHRISMACNGQISVEVYAPKEGDSEEYWRLEVDEEKERNGEWEFKKQNKPQPSDLLSLKFSVLSAVSVMRGVWIV